MKYRVVVDDNFHYMDESERYTHGEFDTADEALSAAKELVEDDLKSFYRAGMKADELYMHYASFGSDPFIVSGDSSCRFSARDYAKDRCQEICDEQDKNLIAQNIEFHLPVNGREEES